MESTIAKKYEHLAIWEVFKQGMENLTPKSIVALEYGKIFSKSSIEYKENGKFCELTIILYDNECWATFSQMKKTSETTEMLFYRTEHGSKS